MSRGKRKLFLVSYSCCQQTILGHQLSTLTTTQRSAWFR